MILLHNRGIISVRNVGANPVLTAVLLNFKHTSPFYQLFLV